MQFLIRLCWFTVPWRSRSFLEPIRSHLLFFHLVEDLANLHNTRELVPGRDDANWNTGTFSFDFHLQFVLNLESPAAVRQSLFAEANKYATFWHCIGRYAQ